MAECVCKGVEGCGEDGCSVGPGWRQTAAPTWGTRPQSGSDPIAPSMLPAVNGGFTALLVDGGVPQKTQGPSTRFGVASLARDDN